MATNMNSVDGKHNEMPPKYDSPSAGYVPPQVPPPAYEFNKGSAQEIYSPYYPAPPQYTPASYALVSSQPCRTATVNTHTTTGDHFLIASVVMTALCCLVCSWLSLLCSIPAILFALSAQNAEARGDMSGARRSRNVALYLNVTAVLVFVICIVVVASSSMKSGGYYH
ncbi:hypothetical protein EMCRGX_G018289 [Ephydatia muelleri]|eukprot:Em0012g703a